MGTLWTLLLQTQVQPLQSGSLFDVVSKAIGEVSPVVWGLVACFAGAVYYAHEDNGWSLKRKIWIFLSGFIFGFALGYGIVNWLELTYWSYIVYAICGAFGFNFVGGIRTLGVKWKKDPLKTANDLNDLRRNIQKIGNNEEPNGDNDVKRNNGSDNPTVEP